MFEPFMPQQFCREYVEVKGDSLQLVNFMAVVLGHKTLMDDWIDVDQLPSYRRVAEQYGLLVEAESIFIAHEKALLPAHVIGAGALTSTSAYGLPVDAAVPADGWAARGARVHLFVSRDPEVLRHGMWYPVIIRDRVIWPPRADLLAYGRLLSYPACCISFFQQRNDWRKYSFLWEIRKRSSTLEPLCNPIGKDRTYSYIYHMPCSFACAATREKAESLRRDIAEREPALVEAIDRHLRLPALVFRERKIYFFEGELRGNRLEYTKWKFEGGEPLSDVLGEWLRQADAVEVEGQTVRVLRGHEEVHRVECRADTFAPEIPFLIRFDDPPL
jgi:hypothetical protein